MQSWTNLPNAILSTSSSAQEDGSASKQTIYNVQTAFRCAVGWTVLVIRSCHSTEVRKRACGEGLISNTRD